jgi:hypothetical protein
MAMYQGLLYFAMGGNSDSPTFPRNVYAWGTQQPQYPQTLTSDYVISTGNNGPSVQLGLLYPVGKKMLVGWRDGLSCGVDVIDPDGPLYKQGYLQTLIQDGGAMWRQDLLLKTRADHLPLNAGESVQIGAENDRAGGFVFNNSGTDPTSRFTSNPLENGRLYEYMVEVVLNGPGNSSPTLLSLTAVTNPLDTEDQI